ncbi:MAG: oligoendopeptidase F [Clostridiales bacterium]|nr:oligoendopeptidase F [Clostridiales bacterium]
MEREKVQECYKWNVKDIFESDEQWESATEELNGKLDFSGYQGKLGDKSILLKYLKASDELTIQLERVAVYANLKRDEDTRKSKYVAYSGKIDMIFSKYCSATAFFEPEMAALNETYLKELIADKDFSDYDYQLKLLLKRRKHVASEKEERLVALSSEALGSFSDIFAMIDNADLPLPEIEWEGKTRKLTHGLYGVILHSADRKKREEAYKKYYSAYIGLLNTITANYYGNVKKDVFLSRVYNFSSCLDHALFSEDVDRKVYENLLESVTENCGVMHRYIADRKKILGVDKLYFYDVYAPLVADAEVKMPYDKAYEYVIEGLGVLGKEYQDLLRRGYNERWIDVEETEGKRNGAYSAGVYGVHPYVLLNYQPTLTDIFTVAHEMGHSLHTYFSQKNQPFAKSEYRIFVAEVASTVNEVLLLKYMLSKAKDDNLKRYLLNYYLDSIRATLHRQTMFAEFEYEAHKLVEEGNPLTRENLCEKYAQIGKKYYGDAIEHDFEISTEWCRIPHFYSSFYVYKYSTGIITAINIANKILTEGEPAVKNYFKFLSGGSSTDPVSLLKLAGVDLYEKQPFVFAMKEFENTLLEFEKLMEI